MPNENLPIVDNEATPTATPQNSGKANSDAVLQQKLKELELINQSLNNQVLTYEKSYKDAAEALEKMKSENLRKENKKTLEANLNKFMVENKVPAEVMNKIVNSYANEDELYTSLGSNPAAGLRGKHWEDIAPYLVGQPQTKPLNLGSMNSKNQTSSTEFDVKKFLENRNSKKGWMS